MPQNIELVIAADRRAGKIVDAARLERTELLKAAKAEQQAALEEGAKKLADLKTSLNYENDSYQKSCKAKSDVDFANKKIALDEVFDTNKDKWLCDMFANITKI